MLASTSFLAIYSARCVHYGGETRYHSKGLSIVLQWIAKQKGTLSHEKSVYFHYIKVLI